MRQTEKNKEVGYKNPPKKSQFKKGESGNPSGRPKRCPSTKELIEKLLAEERTLPINGKNRRIANGEILMRQTLAKASQGDLKFLKWLFETRDRDLTGGYDDDDDVGPPVKVIRIRTVSARKEPTKDDASGE